MSATAAATDTTDTNAPDMGELYDRASLSFAPFAAAILVARADGRLEKKELRAVLEALRDVHSPILQAAIMDGTGPVHKLKALVDNEILGRMTLINAGAHLRSRPGGKAALAELVEIGTRVAMANATRSGFLGLFGEKVLRPQEQEALADLRDLLRAE